jgi:Na+-driven multidrug efflux pump
MTDATPTPPTPDPAATPAAPAYAAAPAAAGPKQTLSLVGFILGIGSVVFAWTFFIGVGAGIAAIIVSRKGRKEEPGAPKWMTQVGIITGIVGIILGVIFGIISLVSILLPLIFLSSYGSVISNY